MKKKSCYSKKRLRGTSGVGELLLDAEARDANEEEEKLLPQPCFGAGRACGVGELLDEEVHEANEEEEKLLPQTRLGVGGIGVGELVVVGLLFHESRDGELGGVVINFLLLDC